MFRVVCLSLWLFVVGAINSAFGQTATTAGKRVALVIGNSAYQFTATLPNPKNDAADVSAALRLRGFEVLDGFDLNKAMLDRKVRDFANALRGAEVGVFFYAGHGLQVAGQNYIVPVDAELTTAAALDFETVRLDLVHRTMERETQTNILFLDACRDNPLSRNLARGMGTRSIEIGRGLAAVESGIGSLISFSTQPGNVAFDGTGRNSPFAGALVRHMSASDDDLSAILIAVRNDVMKETQRKQVPWEHSALTGRFFFKGARPTATGGFETAKAVREDEVKRKQPAEQARLAGLRIMVNYGDKPSDARIGRAVSTALTQNGSTLESSRGLADLVLRVDTSVSLNERIGARLAELKVVIDCQARQPSEHACFPQFEVVGRGEGPNFEAAQTQAVDVAISSLQRQMARLR